MLELRYETIKDSMSITNDYEGVQPHRLLSLIGSIARLMSKAKPYAPMLFEDATIGLLEHNPMIVGSWRSGLVKPDGSELEGLALFPYPSKVDRSIAILEPNRTITAIYENITGYTSFAVWNDRPIKSEDILDDLLIPPYDIEASRGLSGIEIAVRYLSG